MAKKYKIESAALADAETSSTDLISRFWIDWTTSDDEGTIRVLNDDGKHFVTSFNPNRQDLDFCRAVMAKLTGTLTLLPPTVKEIASDKEPREEEERAEPRADEPAPPPAKKGRRKKEKAADPAPDENRDVGGEG
jgi:hypothetical protein